MRGFKKQSVPQICSNEIESEFSDAIKPNSSDWLEEVVLAEQRVIHRWDGWVMQDVYGVLRGGTEEKIWGGKQTFVSFNLIINLNFLSIQ
jgi:hypothetical protein